MPELTLQHIDQITNDISKEEISFSHLLHDLIDHVCCDVENEMHNGLSFAEAYREVRKKIGSRGIKEIQEETLYLVDTKYRKMKNTMKISGAAGTILLGFAAIFKIQHYPGAGILLTLGAIILAFVFLPTALGVLWKETHSRKRLFLFISAFFAGMFFISGTLFKIQHWPGAGYLLSLAALSGILFFIPALLVSRLNEQENKAKRPIYIIGAAGVISYVAGMLFKIQHWPLATILMVIGMILLCYIAFPWYTWISWKEESHVSARFLFMVIAFIVIIIPGTLLNLNLQGTYNNGYYPHLEQQQKLYSFRYDGNILLMNHYRDSAYFPIMESLHFKTTGLLNLIGDIETKMVAEAEGKPGVPAFSPAQITQTDRGPEINYRLISNPFHTAPAKDFLLPGSSSRLEINNALKEYINYLSDLTSTENNRKLRTLIDPSVILPDESPDESPMSLLSALHSTVLLKNSILTVESSFLKSISKNQ